MQYSLSAWFLDAILVLIAHTSLDTLDVIKPEIKRKWEMKQSKISLQSVITMLFIVII